MKRGRKREKRQKGKKKRIKKKIKQKLSRNISSMKRLLHASPSHRRAILKRSSPELLSCISDSAVNVLKGNVPLTSSQFNSLKRRKKAIRSLANPHLNLDKKRSILMKQKGSGFFLPLLSAVIPAITSLIASK